MLQGDNAQGKTNLLEAIHILATAKSHRATADRELINWSCLSDELIAARVTALVATREGDVRIELSLSNYNTKGESQIQKRIKINGVPRRSSELFGKTAVVLFTSHDIELIYGAPSRRRRYLDIAGSQVNPKYLNALQRYNKILLHRNHLLKLIGDRQAEESQLEFWDQEMAKHGSYIIEQRRIMIDELNSLAPNIHEKISAGESFRINYAPSVDIGDFRKRLHEVRRREIAQRVSVIGPHRDDMSFLTNGNDVNVYGSRGQQRTATLSLKLAESGYLHARINDEPIILLDDVLSELDSMRRHRLLEALSSFQQVVITTTDIDHIEPVFLSGASRFQVSEGTVVPMQ